jgi:DNA modification methylase
MIYHGDCLSVLRKIKSSSLQSCVSSPPYWGLRDYGVEEQIGLEETPEQYISKIIKVFREVKRVLKDDGTLWLNLGDSYTKSKELVGIPWRVAFALQADGWYLRQDIIWNKPNPMPESVKDRCTKAHEYIFLLTKTQKYYYDANAILEPFADREFRGKIKGLRGSQAYSAARGNDRCNSGGYPRSREGRNKRSVWTVVSRPFKGAHFATFPPELIEPCILAGTPKQGVVLDPFFGSGTVGMVARKHGRKFLGIEINANYVKIAEARIKEADAGS